MEQPHVDLIAQDASAPLVVIFWAKIQGMIQERMEQGLTMEQALEAVRRFYVLDDMDGKTYPDAKRAGAMLIAGAMVTFPNRKLAD